ADAAAARDDRHRREELPRRGEGARAGQQPGSAGPLPARGGAAGQGRRQEGARDGGEGRQLQRPERQLRLRAREGAPDARQELIPFLAPSAARCDNIDVAPPTRREGLRTIAIGAAGLGAGCFTGRAPRPAARPSLAPVRVSPAREIRTVVGLRPFRPAGFVVRADKLGDKLVVQNYGHGGGGVTLSWGTADLAA